jgi:hypothetical protein
VAISCHRWLFRVHGSHQAGFTSAIVRVVLKCRHAHRRSKGFNARAAGSSTAGCELTVSHRGRGWWKWGFRKQSSSARWEAPRRRGRRSRSSCELCSWRRVSGRVWWVLIGDCVVRNLRTWTTGRSLEELLTADGSVDIRKATMVIWKNRQRPEVISELADVLSEVSEGGCYLTSAAREIPAG